MMLEALFLLFFLRMPSESWAAEVTDCGPDPSVENPLLPQAVTDLAKLIPSPAPHLTTCGPEGDPIRAAPNSPIPLSRAHPMGAGISTLTD